MSFGAPVFLAGLALIPLAIAALVARRRRAKRYAVRFTGVRTLKLASAGVPLWRKHLPAALALCALAALVLALAKPQRSVAVPTGRGSIMLVTDHSLSMVATDVRPSRLAAAQAAAHAFLDRVPSQVGVGVVAYSSAPDAVRPPSTDHSQARDVIDSQQADGATDTGDALQVAIDTLVPAGSKTKRLPSSILLLSDGRTTIGRDPVPVAREAGRLHIPIYTVSVGTEDALIPNPGFGPPLPVPPDPATLRQDRAGFRRQGLHGRGRGPAVVDLQEPRLAARHQEGAAPGDVRVRDRRSRAAARRGRGLAALDRPAALAAAR